MGDGENAGQIEVSERKKKKKKKKRKIDGVDHAGDGQGRDFDEGAKRKSKKPAPKDARNEDFEGNRGGDGRCHEKKTIESVDRGNKNKVETFNADDGGGKDERREGSVLENGDTTTSSKKTRKRKEMSPGVDDRRTSMEENRNVSGDEMTSKELDATREEPSKKKRKDRDPNEGDESKVDRWKGNRKKKKGVDSLVEETEVDGNKGDEDIGKRTRKEKKKKKKKKRKNTTQGMVLADKEADISDDGDERSRQKTKDSVAEAQHLDKDKRQRDKSKETPTVEETEKELQDSAGTRSSDRGTETSNKKKKKVSFGGVVVLNEGTDKDAQEGQTATGRLAFASAPERPPCEGRLKDPLYLKKFTKEEDETIEQTVRRFAEDKGLDVHDTYRLYIKIRKELSAEERVTVRELTKLVANCLPARNPNSTRGRAKIVLDIFSKRGVWTREEEEQLRSLVEKHGKNWAVIGRILGRKSHLLEAKYNYISNLEKKGHYKPEEVAAVTFAVHKILAEQARLGMPRQRNDDLPWRAISKLVPGRPPSHCRVLWYRDLCSSMVKTKEWGNGDDHLLLLRILESGVPDEESIDWDNLLPHRSGEVCRKRWNEMRAHLGHKWNWPFEKKLEVLIQRFAPCFLEEPAASCAITLRPEIKSRQVQGQTE